MNLVPRLAKRSLGVVRAWTERHQSPEGAWELDGRGEGLGVPEWGIVRLVLSFTFTQFCQRQDYRAHFAAVLGPQHLHDQRD